MERIGWRMMELAQRIHLQFPRRCWNASSSAGFSKHSLLSWSLRPWTSLVQETFHSHMSHLMTKSRMAVFCWLNHIFSPISFPHFLIPGMTETLGTSRVAYNVNQYWQRWINIDVESSLTQCWFNVTSCLGLPPRPPIVIVLLRCFTCPFFFSSLSVKVPQEISRTHFTTKKFISSLLSNVYNFTLVKLEDAIVPASSRYSQWIRWANSTAPGSSESFHPHGGPRFLPFAFLSRSLVDPPAENRL